MRGKLWPKSLFVSLIHSFVWLTPQGKSRHSSQSGLGCRDNAAAVIRPPAEVSLIEDNSLEIALCFYAKTSSESIVLSWLNVLAPAIQREKKAQASAERTGPSGFKPLTSAIVGYIVRISLLTPVRAGAPGNDSSYPAISAGA